MTFSVHNHPRTPAGSPDGGKFASKPGRHEADGSLLGEPTAPKGVFSLEAFPDVYLKTAAAPQPGGWNGFPVPQATPDELTDYADAVNRRFSGAALKVTVAPSPGDRKVIELTAHLGEDGDTDHHIGAWTVSNSDEPLPLDGLTWDEHDLDEADLCSHCGASLDDGAGWDGLCGTCADRAEPDGEDD